MIYFLFLRVLFFKVFLDFLQKLRFLPEATLHPLTFLHLFGFLTLFPLHKDLEAIIYNIDFIYALGKGARHKRISPKLATLYLTTRGKSFSRYTSI